MPNPKMASTIYDDDARDGERRRERSGHPIDPSHRALVERIIPDGHGLTTEWWRRQFRLEDTECARRWLMGTLGHGPQPRVTADGFLFFGGHYSGYIVTTHRKPNDGFPIRR